MLDEQAEAAQPQPTSRPPSRFGPGIVGATNAAVANAVRRAAGIRGRGRPSRMEGLF